ncbi:MAG: hypothetical protein IH624_04850 [Phycisphaerae bacterium]|nr:hypothetical protein [Phycisphaerae bacterium]
MQKQKGLTRVEVVVVVVLLLLAVWYVVAFHKSETIAKRIVCGSVLKGLGTAMTVYGNDYDGHYPVQGGEAHTLWATRTDGWYDPSRDWASASQVTVGASLYLLIREADVSPKSFVCTMSREEQYGGQAPSRLDITELWDFGEWTPEPVKAEDDGIGNAHGPRNHVSYAYHMPYGPEGARSEFAAGGKHPAAFAVMADKNPWFDGKLETSATGRSWKECVGAMQLYEGRRASKRREVRSANARAHGREGQNVLFADGHYNYERVSDAAINRDNIYTRQAEGGSEEAIRIGDPDEMPTYTIDNKFQPRNGTDSFLVNDDSRLAPYGSVK